MTKNSHDQKLIANLASEIRERRIILFVGSGISADLGLPTWDEFISRLGEELGFEPHEFFGFSQDFRSLAEYYRLEQGSIDALCRKMGREWQVDDATLDRSVVHRLLVSFDFPLIYTTNYDHLLERAYERGGRRFNKIVSARDIAKSDPALPTIVKFHGDLDDPSSVVLAETDYFRRLAFSEPLDIKLAADAFARGVLFLGYSVSDINLRLLLYRLRRIWLESGYEKSRPRSYVYITPPNPVQERILSSWDVVPLTTATGDSATDVSSFLNRLHAAVCNDTSATHSGRDRFG
jgi:SIR2-like domain